MKMVKIDGCLLKPCPHCEKLGYLTVDYDNMQEQWELSLYKVICLHCGTSGAYETSSQTAANSWNSLPRRTGNKM